MEEDTGPGRLFVPGAIVEEVDDHAAWEGVSAAKTEQTGHTIVEGDVCSVKEVEKVDGDAVSADVVEDALWRVSCEDAGKSNILQSGCGRETWGCC